MKRTKILVGLFALAIVGASFAAVPARGHDFYRKQPSQVGNSPRDSYVIERRPWGGPTTPKSWWTETYVPVGSPHHGHSGWSYPFVHRNTLNLRFSQYNYYLGPFGQVYLVPNNVLIFGF